MNKVLQLVKFFKNKRTIIMIISSLLNYFTLLIIILYFEKREELKGFISLQNEFSSNILNNIIDHRLSSSGISRLMI